MADEGYGSLLNRRAVPALLLGLCGLLVVLSFAVGWFSTDVALKRWVYDPNEPDGKGDSAGPLTRIGLEMKMLSMDVHATPVALENAIQQRGEPSYEDNAGRIGTVMLGILLLQVAVLVAFAALALFYYLHLRGRRDHARVLKRLAVVFLGLTFLTLVYFAVRIGPAAEKDEQNILESYPPSDEAAYAALKPDVGFWKTWRSTAERVEPRPGIQEVWQFTVSSRPAAGWWLELGALLLGAGSFVLAVRNGDLEAEPRPEASGSSRVPTS